MAKLLLQRIFAHGQTLSIAEQRSNDVRPKELAVQEQAITRGRLHAASDFVFFALFQRSRGKEIFTASMHDARVPKMGESVSNVATIAPGSFDRLHSLPCNFFCRSFVTKRAFHSLLSLGHVLRMSAIICEHQDTQCCSGA